MVRLPRLQRALSLVSHPNGTSELIVGGFGGICAVLVGHPFDLIKVRLQTAEKGVYTGALDVAKKSLARDGFKGLYRGVSAPLIGVTPMFAVSFWVSAVLVRDSGTETK